MTTIAPIQSGGEAMPETRDLDAAHDVLTRAKQLNELIFMASEGLQDRNMACAFTTGADIINDLLVDAQAIIVAVMDRKAGAA